jgi:hypothetical protein
MAVQNYKDLISHYGHTISIAIYGEGNNVSLECEHCFEVLLDFDNEVD